MKEKHPTLTVIGTYKNNRTKIEMHCDVCGYSFYSTPGSMCFGSGCPKCGGTMKKTQDEFIEEVKTINPNIIVLGDYKSTDNKVLLKCSICNHKWEATPHSILSGKGCPKCSGVNRKTHDEFVEEMNREHPEIIVIGKYSNNRHKITMRCSICGTYFDKSPHDALSKNTSLGCPNCKKSDGELKIDHWLKSHQIQFIHEYRFNDCKDKYALPFDFYIKSLNTAIEYDGVQHFKSNAFFGGEKAFSILQMHDQIKNEYCSTHGIHLIRISYFDYDRIDEILSAELAS